MLTALLLSLSLAAPGDAIYTKQGPKTILTTVQKTELASALASMFPDVPPATLDRYYCFSDPDIEKTPDRTAIDVAAFKASFRWSCVAVDGDATISDSDAFDYEINPDAHQCRVVDRPTKTMLRCDAKGMNSDAKLLNEAFLQSVFTVALDSVWDFGCERNPKDTTEVTCVGSWIKIASTTVWRADRRTGSVNLSLGKTSN